MVKKARKDKKCLQVEQKCLERLGAKANITKKTPEEQEAENRRLKRVAKKGMALEVGAPIPADYGHVLPMVDNDLEEEEEEMEHSRDEE
jgi:hypothetical protein